MIFSDLFAFDADIRVHHQSGEGVKTAVKGIALAAELSENNVTFVKNAKFLSTLTGQLTKAPVSKVAAIVDRKLYEGLPAEQKESLHQSLCVLATCSNVPLTMARLSKPVYQDRFGKLQSIVDGRQMGNVEIHPSALIAQGVFLGEHVKIGAGVVLHSGVTIAPMVEIGDHTTLYSNVSVYSFTKIGKNVRVHANTTIGSDGFGYVFDKGIHHKIWHNGGVVIKDDVEIGANCSVDMGTFSPTVIGAGTRIDNQVQIAHNVKIGTGCILCGQAGVAGSAVLEDYVVLGGRAAIGPDSLIGKGTQVAGGAMVNEGAVWPAGSVLGGHPARDLKEWMRTFAWVRKNALKN